MACLLTVAIFNAYNIFVSLHFALWAKCLIAVHLIYRKYLKKTKNQFQCITLPDFSVKTGFFAPFFSSLLFSYIYSKSLNCIRCGQELSHVPNMRCENRLFLAKFTSFFLHPIKPHRKNDFFECDENYDVTYVHFFSSIFFLIHKYVMSQSTTACYFECS